MSIIATLGGDRLTTVGAIEALSGFETSSAINLVPDLNIQRSSGEGWYTLNSNLSSAFIRNVVDNPDGTDVDTEFHFTFHFNANEDSVPTMSGLAFMGSGSSSSGFIRLEVVANPLGGPNVYQITSSFGYFSPVTTSFLAIPGEPLNVCLRMRASSDDDITYMEAYLNGVQVLEDTRSLPNTSAPYGGNGGISDVRVRSISPNNCFFRNLQVLDKWSTPNNVPPQTRYVYEAPASIVEAPDFDIVGNAATAEEALNDGDGSTAIETQFRAATARISLDVPSDIANLSLLSAEFSSLSAKLSSDDTDVTVRVTSVDFQTVREQEVVNLVQPTPSRQNVRVTHLPTDGVLAGDVAVEIINDGVN